eukprot:s2_g72.t1
MPCGRRPDSFREVVAICGGPLPSTAAAMCAERVLRYVSYREDRTGRAVSTAYQSMEEAQEMLTLAQRHISDELLQQVERHQEYFDMPKAPSRSGSEGAMVAMELFERLRRMSAERAEDMVVAMEGELQALKSSVLDVSLPQVGDDRRLVLVGDLHGQLQDILHIFEEHGPPSEEVAYVFNGDIVGLKERDEDN